MFWRFQSDTPFYQGWKNSSAWNIAFWAPQSIEQQESEPLDCESNHFLQDFMRIGAGKEGTVSEHSRSGLLTSGPLSWTWVCLELSLFWGGIVVYFFVLFCLVSCISTFPELPYSFWVCRTLWGLKCTKKGKILRWAFLFNFNGFFKVLYYIVENSNRQQTHMALGAITKWSATRGSSLPRKPTALALSSLSPISLLKGNHCPHSETCEFYLQLGHVHQCYTLSMILA